MACLHDDSSKFVKHSWGRRLRVAAALVALIAGIPGALATIVFLAHFLWADPTRIYRSNGKSE
jgi:hypothetical protein